MLLLFLLFLVKFHIQYGTLFVVHLLNLRVVKRRRDKAKIGEDGKAGEIIRLPSWNVNVDN